MYILTDGKWVRQSNGRVPDDAIQAGHEPNGKPIYIGRGWYEDRIQVGNVMPEHGGLVISHDGKLKSQTIQYERVCLRLFK
jgi:hypothetical protein